MEISRPLIEQLADHHEAASISLYAPMEVAGPETRQNPIRFKNLLQKADEILAESGKTPKEREEYLEPLWRRVEDYEFWQHQEPGLAVFFDGGKPQELALPVAVEEQLVIGERFHLLPLLQLLDGEDHFFILAFSQKRVRLFVARLHHVEEVNPGNLPTSLEDVVGHRLEEQHLQFHSSQASGRAPVYHGQGGGEDDQLPELAAFCRELDSKLRDRLYDHKAPLVLATTERLASMYREVSEYPNLVAEHVPGNMDEATAEQLHRQALPLVEPVFRRPQEKAAARYQARSNGDTISHGLEPVVIAAHDGRIDTLFVARGHHAWGRYEEDKREVERTQAPAGSDLVDAAAIATLRYGGTVFTVDEGEMPEPGATVAALLRYG